MHFVMYKNKLAENSRRRGWEKKWNARCEIAGVIEQSNFTKKTLILLSSFGINRLGEAVFPFCWSQAFESCSRAAVLFAYSLVLYNIGIIRRIQKKMSRIFPVHHQQKRFIQQAHDHIRSSRSSPHVLLSAKGSAKQHFPNGAQQAWKYSEIGFVHLCM